MTVNELISDFSENTNIEILDNHDNTLIRKKLENCVDDPDFQEIGWYEVDNVKIDGNALIIATDFESEEDE